MLFKWALVCLGLVLGGSVALLGISSGWQWWSHDRHLRHITIEVSTSSELCEDPQSPVFLRVRNGSTRSIEAMSIYIHAQRLGQSTDLTSFQSYQLEEVIEPGGQTGRCWPAALGDGAMNEDPRTLEWSIRSYIVYFVAR